jgi:hypothetical protein
MQVFLTSTWLGGGQGNWPALDLGDPICLDLPTLQANQAEEDRRQRHIASAIEFFNNTIGDTPTEILATKGIPRLQRIFSDNIQSRISPAGEFPGFEGAVEYFYGFVANPTLRCINVDYKEISATGNLVGAKVNLWLVTSSQQAALTGNHPPLRWNLTLFTTFIFDSNDKITSIDMAVPNLGAILDIPASQPNSAQIKANVIVSVCATLTMNTTVNPNPNGTCGHIPGLWAGNTPLQRFQSCVNFMNSIPYGTRERNNANSFACRSLHTPLTFFRPDPHCFHAGPTGGGACIDFTYESYFQKDY